MSTFFSLWGNRGRGIEKFVKNGWHYDMNSQFPAFPLFFAMLKDMLTVNPVFTTKNDLMDIFGFVFAKITPPNESLLPNLFFQNRDELA